MTALSLLILLLSGMPVAFVLIGVTFVFMLTLGNTGLISALPQIMYGNVENFDLLAIPLFVMLGEMMNEGGMTRRIVAAARSWLKRIPHDLPFVNLVANLVLAAIMGSATAQIAVMSRVMVPAMEKEGYDRGYAAALTASAGLLGPIIPPSMPFIIYGVVAQVSIADMFTAGIVPGLMLFALISVLVFWQAGRNHTPVAVDNDAPVVSFLRVNWNALPTLVIPLVIVGGITFGIFTPTESAAVAIVVAILVGTLAYRELTWKALPGILDRTARNSAIVLFLIMSAKVFGWVLTYNQVPQAVAAFITTLTADPIIFMLLIFMALSIVGMFLDGIAALIILVPILLPVAATYGIDPIQFGVMTALTLVLGLLTPPVGAGLYIAAAMSNINITRLSRLVFPYVIATCIVILAVILFPWMVRPFG
ncbi:MAG: TRAP transporter large permease [Allorhizobium sp.]